MKEFDLNERLITYLSSDNCSKENNPVSLLENILNLDAETINLRLNNKVSFTIEEMGVIIRELNIPVDFLFANTPNTSVADLPFEMFRSPSIVTFDDLIDLIDNNLNRIQEMNDGSLVVGQVLDSIPIEFYSPYPHLTKFMYYKWYYYFLKDKTILPVFSDWEIPDRLLDSQQNLVDGFGRFKSVYYIWNSSIIWNLVNEISYMHSIYQLTLSDITSIKKDIHALLHRMENVAKGKAQPPIKAPDDFKIYIYGVNMGINCCYMYNEKDYAVCYRTQFVESPLHSGINYFGNMYTWINSIKKSSVLISGANERERIGFFQLQKRIVNQA